jgi:hypothetical protein
MLLSRHWICFLACALRRCLAVLSSRPLPPLALLFSPLPLACKAHVSTDGLRSRAIRAAHFFKRDECLGASAAAGVGAASGPAKPSRDSRDANDRRAAHPSPNGGSSGGGGPSDHFGQSQAPGLAALLYLCHPAAVAAGCCGSTEPLTNLPLLLALRLAYCAVRY